MTARNITEAGMLGRHHLPSSRRQWKILTTSVRRASFNQPSCAFVVSKMIRDLQQLAEEEPASRTLPTSPADREVNKRRSGIARTAARTIAAEMVMPAASRIGIAQRLASSQQEAAGPRFAAGSR